MVICWLSSRFLLIFVSSKYKLLNGWQSKHCFLSYSSIYFRERCLVSVLVGI